MDSAELKIELIKGICSTEDVRILEEINKILKAEIKEGNNYISSEESLLPVNEAIEPYEDKTFLIKNDDVHVFTPDQRKRIETALEQYKNGECISDEEADKEIQAWL